MALIYYFVQTFNIVLAILKFAIIARVLMSWFNPRFEHEGIGRILYDITEPVIAQARRLPHTIGMMDLSPIIALFGLDILGYLVTSLVNYII